MPILHVLILITQNWLLIELCESVGLPLPLSYLCCKPSFCQLTNLRNKFHSFLPKPALLPLSLDILPFDASAPFTGPFPIFNGMLCPFPREIVVALPYKHVSLQLAHCAPFITKYCCRILCPHTSFLFPSLTFRNLQYFSPHFIRGKLFSRNQWFPVIFSGGSLLSNSL